MKLEMLGKRHLDYNVLGLVALGRVDSKILVSPCLALQELHLFWQIIVNKIIALCRLKGIEKRLSCLLNIIFYGATLVLYQGLECHGTSTRGTSVLH
jgi:hypothetical protein